MHNQWTVLGKAVPMLGLGCIWVGLSGCASTDQSSAQAAQSGASGGVFSCVAEQGLRSLFSDVRVPVVFVNQSNEEVQLYWLNYSGARISYGTIPPNHSKPMSTFITHPWVIEKPTGHCYEIVLPGQLTRTTVIQPGEYSSTGTSNESRQDAAMQAAAANVGLSGLWKFDGIVRDGDVVLTEIRPMCVLTQTGNEISGSCKGPANEGKVTGQSDGTRVNLEWHIADGKVAPVSFKGILETDGAIDGEMRFPTYAPVPFTATRE